VFNTKVSVYWKLLYRGVLLQTLTPVSVQYCKGRGFTLENVHLTLYHINFKFSGFVSLCTAHQAKSHKPETNKEKVVSTCEWTPASSRTVVLRVATVEMRFVEITMKKSINNKLFLADGQGDRQTDRQK